MKINLEWNLLINKILKEGESCAPRGMQTREILAHQSIIDMNYPIVSVPERKMNYKFMCGEAYWILSGSNRVANITQFMKTIGKFSDNGIMFNGAYGPKVVEQLSYVIDNLTTDINSRQAVLNIWRENPRPSKDVPCTLNLQWFIRDNKLHCKTNMRSSDAWLGWVYDAFNFSMISAWLNIALIEKYPELRLGDLYLSAGSQHLYEKNFEVAAAINHSNVCDMQYVTYTPFNPHAYNSPDDLTMDLFNAGTKEWDEVVSPFILQIKDL